MTKPGGHPDIEDPRVRAKWAYCGGFTDVRPGGEAHPNLSKIAVESSHVRGPKNGPLRAASKDIGDLSLLTLRQYYYDGHQNGAYNWVFPI